MSRVIALVITLSEITPPTVLELFMFMPYAALSIVFWIISPESFDMFKNIPCFVTPIILLLFTEPAKEELLITIPLPPQVFTVLPVILPPEQLS